MTTEERKLPAEVDKRMQLQAFLRPADAVAELQKLREVVRAYLEVGKDYGKMPGTDKDCLFLPGAQKLGDIYQLYGDPTILASTEDWDKQYQNFHAPLFDYTVRCAIKGRSNDTLYGVGLGSCNSYEKKYLWRQGKRRCPECGKESIKPSKKEWGGGFYCDPKAEGCNASWKQSDNGKRKATKEDIEICRQIEAQDCSKTVNDDLPSCKNTVLKMAKKRAFIDGMISATRSSGIFTQDVEDFLDHTVVTVMPTKEDWNKLIRDCEAHGLLGDDVKAFCKQEQAKGLTLDAVYATARAFFLEDTTNATEFDWDAIDEESAAALDTAYRDRIADPTT